MSKLNKFIISILISFSACVIGSIFTIDNIATWYNYLNKPSLNPPNWIFAPVWTVLYFLMGVAFYFVWSNEQKHKKHEKNFAIKIFIVQLILNTLWTISFFGLKEILASLFIIILLLIMILLNIISFYRVDKKSGLILIPYILWICFASYLNLSVFILN